MQASVVCIRCVRVCIAVCIAHYGLADKVILLPTEIFFCDFFAAFIPDPLCWHRRGQHSRIDFSLICCLPSISFYSLSSNSFSISAPASYSLSCNNLHIINNSVGATANGNNCWHLCKGNESYRPYWRFTPIESLNSRATRRPYEQPCITQRMASTRQFRQLAT